MNAFLRILVGAALGAILGCCLFLNGWLVMLARYGDDPRFSGDAGMIFGVIVFFGGAITCVGAAVIGAIAALVGRILVGTILGLVAALIVLAYVIAQFGNEPVFLIPTFATAVSWFASGSAAAAVGKVMKAKANRATTAA